MVSPGPEKKNLSPSHTLTLTVTLSLSLSLDTHRLSAPPQLHTLGLLFLSLTFYLSAHTLTLSISHTQLPSHDAMPSQGEVEGRSCDASEKQKDEGSRSFTDDTNEREA